MSSDETNSRPAASPLSQRSELEVAPSQAYRLTLPEFEGPLDLLLHLCQTHEIDILNIPIAFVCEKYCDYLEMMEGMAVEVAAEYLVMAAHLAYLKSRELVPAPEPIETTGEDGEEEEELDPREALIKRLLEYQKYKAAAEQLGSRPIEGRNVFVRGMPIEDTAGDAGLAEHSIWKLIEQWANVLGKAAPQHTHDVVINRMSITDRINQVVDMLESGKGTLRFEDLLGRDLQPQELRHKVVISLLAVLELARLKVIRVVQDLESGVFLITQVEGAQLANARKVRVTSAIDRNAKDEEDEVEEAAPVAPPTVASAEQSSVEAVAESPAPEVPADSVVEATPAESVVEAEPSTDPAVETTSPLDSEESIIEEVAEPSQDAVGLAETVVADESAAESVEVTADALDSAAPVAEPYATVEAAAEVMTEAPAAEAEAIENAAPVVADASAEEVAFDQPVVESTSDETVLNESAAEFSEPAVEAAEAEAARPPAEADAAENANPSWEVANTATGPEDAVSPESGGKDTDGQT
jgi:segregation and condensation protein A